MVTIYIDDKPYEVSKTKNMLEAALDLGLEVPYFCWHPALGSVGACRQCAVQQLNDTNDTKGKTVMACMTPVAEQMRVSIEHPDAKEFRQRVIEWMMINHPHDCPVCDEGGECHLQDMTVLVGHKKRNYRFAKRTFENQNLGPFIRHEMNRCITCYRCVRYYRNYAGGKDLHSYASSNRIYFGRFESGTLENQFSGNLVEVCPTGVFTDKPFYQHFTRKWDLQTAPSICQLCGVGCNVLASERGGSLKRINNRFHNDVNGYFLCDRGRFGHGFVNIPRRLHVPYEVVEKHKQTLSSEQAFERLHKLMEDSKHPIGIASPRASLESSWALRTKVGKEAFFAGVDPLEWKTTLEAFSLLSQSEVPIASLKDMENADAVLILGEDVMQTAPRLGLSIRQVPYQIAKQKASLLGIPSWNDAGIRNGLREEKGPIYTLTPMPTELDALSHAYARLSALQISDLTKAVTKRMESSVLSDDTEQQAAEQTIYAQLSSAKAPIIVCGISLREPALIRSAFSLAHALKNRGKSCKIITIFPGPNHLGLAFLGAKPIDQLKNSDLGIVLEGNLEFTLGPSRHALLQRLISTWVHLDFYSHSASANAQLVLPIPSFAEQTGSLINNEGRIQRFYSVFPKTKHIQEAFRWLFGFDTTLFTLTKKLCQEEPSLKPFFDYVQSMEQKEPIKLPRQSRSYSGRTATTVNLNIHEQTPPKDLDSPFAYSMEGQTKGRPLRLLSIVQKPGWNSNQAIFKKEAEQAQFTEKDIFLFSDVKPNHIHPIDIENEEKGVGEFVVVPLYQVFGSEECSRLSLPIMERSEEAYAVIHPDDAEELHIEAGNNAHIIFKDQDLTLPIQIQKEWVKKTVGIPVGTTPLGLAIPKKCQLERIS